MNMWACYLGEISEPYQHHWKPQTVSPDQNEPDIFDVLTNDKYEICYRLDERAAAECFSDCIQVDWGGWAYKATKAQMEAYNRSVSHKYLIPQPVIDRTEDDHVYGIIDVEIY